MDDPQFHRLLEQLGFSREGYRRVRKGVKKRLRRHMQTLGYNHLEEYLEAIAAEPRVRSGCLRCLSVPISRFMRDAEFWDILAARILPDLVARFGAPLSVWSAGCACGEEAYSLAICATKVGHAMAENAPGVDIMATDRNPECLVRAREGVYPRSSFREVDARQMARCFIALRGGRRYRIQPEFKSRIDWICCDIERLPILGSFHAVFLRNNILTYREGPGQAAVLERVLDHLRPGGILVVGARERLPAARGALVPCYGLPYVYARSVV